MFKSSNIENQTSKNKGITSCKSIENRDLIDHDLLNNDNDNNSSVINKEVEIKRKRNNIRCKKCCKRKKRKKVLILFKCRCGYKFCIECLLPESHECDFNYKEIGKKTLENNNPKVDYKKIIPI
jgi:hypothetical protein